MKKEKIKVNSLQEAIKRVVPNLNAEIPHFSLVSDGYAVNFDIDMSGSITYEDFEALSILFNTKKISSSDFVKTRGCETCDYGSSKWATIYITGIPKESFEKLLKRLDIKF